MVEAFVRSFAVLDICYSNHLFVLLESFSPQLLIYSLYILLDQLDLRN